MTEPKQLPQKFAVMIKPEIALVPYILDAARCNELTLPDEYHIEDIEVQVNSSFLDPTDKLVRITSNVVAGPSAASAAASTDDLIS